MQTWLRIGDYDKARQSAADFQDIFGKDNYFLELMDHGLAIETRVRDGLLRLSQDLGIPPIATNDSHYVHQADAHVATSTCSASPSGSVMSDPKRFKLDGDGYYIKSAAEMRELWERTTASEACDNTLLIAERCDVAFTEGRNFMPRFPVPPGETEESWFVKEVERGLAAPLPRRHPRRGRRRGPTSRSASSPQMGFPGYFLVVADFINWAKDNGIRVGPGRGSAAGSIVAYAMGITDLDPLEHGLLFERFLNPERVSMPDFDIDFDERGRGEVDPLRHREVRRRPGRPDRHLRHHQGQAGRQGLQPDPRLPVRDGRPDHQGDAGRGDGQGRPAQARSSTPSHKRYGEGGEFRALYEADNDVKTVVDTADRHRGPQAAVGRARRRRDHVQRAAARRDPDHEARGRTARSSPSSTTRPARRSA